MAATKEEIKELAEHIYDLDAEVYVHLGSSLGRVFNRDRERCVNELTELLTTRPQGHLVRSELGLIANMARTIEDKEERAMCMTEYNRILNEVMSLPTSFASGDVIDPILAKLNSFNVANRFSNDDHLIICISRTYACGGNDIYKAVKAGEPEFHAERFAPNYCDYHKQKPYAKHQDTCPKSRLSAVVC